MGMPNFRGGVKSLGVPVLPGNVFAGLFATNVLFVDGTNGSNSYDGKKPTRAKKTIQAAINAASTQDVIYIRTLAPDADASDPGQYAEDLTIAYAKHGLKLIGATPHLGPYAGPKIKNATATVLLNVLASGIVLENLQFNCTRNSGTWGIYLDGIAGYATKAGSVGATIANCFIKNGSMTAPSGSLTYSGINIIGGYGCIISDCIFQMCVRAIWLSSGILPSNGHIIQRCDFRADNGTAIGEHITIIAGSHKDIVIRDCTFDKATSFLSVGDANVSGIIARCQFNDLVATLANSTGKVKVPAASMTVVGCQGGVGLDVIQSQV